MAGEIKLMNKIEFEKQLRQIDKDVQEEIAVKAVRAGGHVIEAHTKVNLENLGLRDKGQLINSIKVYDTVRKGLQSYCFVGSRGVIYARVHEFGARIIAKRVKNLAIPVTKAAKKAGSPRRFSRDLKYFPARTRGGYLFSGKGKKLTLQYVLKPSVMIPARPYLRPAVDENRQKIRDEMAFVISAELNKRGIK